MISQEKQFARSFVSGVKRLDIGVVIYLTIVAVCIAYCWTPTEPVGIRVQPIIMASHANTVIKV